MKKNKLPSLITILIMTLITIVMWVSLSVYQALSRKPAPSVPQEVINPLTPTLDKGSLDKIQSRLFLDDSQIPEVKPVPSISPTPAPTPEVTPVETATPEPTPSETPTPEPTP